LLRIARSENPNFFGFSNIFGGYLVKQRLRLYTSSGKMGENIERKVVKTRRESYF